MKSKDFIAEVPLPTDWDKNVYKPDVSFAKRIRYATEKAKKIGTGSARIAFNIEFEGRDTILKIAKNKKGLAQNEYEAQMLDDSYVVPLGITIPMIDYDEEHNEPLWLHVEKASKVTAAQFKKYFSGMSPVQLLDFSDAMTGQRNMSPEENEKYEIIYEENEAANSFVDLVGNYPDLARQDFDRLANWGIYNGDVVIIDVGANMEIIKTYYLK